MTFTITYEEAHKAYLVFSVFVSFCLGSLLGWTLARK